jgi:hypothetical protein
MELEMTQPPNEKPHAAHVERLRRRLALPAIELRDARDGVLDCFVATYQEGLAAGMHGILGIASSPSDVERVAESIFRARLLEEGVSFESPTIEALARVKQAADDELHFGELPVELRATHDRVCELLLAKAEGSLPHAGDHSAVLGGRPTLDAARAPTVASAGTAGTVARAAREVPRGAADPLREAVAVLFEDLAARARSPRPLRELVDRLEKARRLVDTVHALELD